MTGQADKRPPPLVVPLLHTALSHPFETLAIDVQQNRLRRVDPANRITILSNGHESDIYAAGDMAQGPDFSTGRQEVHAIQPTAVEHGRIAALNMAGADTPFRGSLSMNVLNTLGLVSSSFGLWMGVEGGERSVAVDEARSRYLRLEFEDDRIVGALALGLTQHVGVVRGLSRPVCASGHGRRSCAPTPPW